MSNPSFRDTNYAIAALGLALSLGFSACGGEEGALEIGDSSEDLELRWEDYLASAVPYEGGWVVEDDLRFESEEALHTYFLATQGPGNGLAGFEINGVLAKWAPADKRTLRYCLGSLGSRQAEVEAAMHHATQAWEAELDVDFFHLKSQDGANCTNANLNVLFNVRVVANTPFIAAAFFPGDARASRELLIDTTAFALASPRSLVGTLRHELGHVLGFRHEFARGDAPGTCFEANLSHITSYDPGSVMNRFQGEVCGDARSDQVSPLDVQGGAFVYNAGASSDRLVGDFNGDGRSDVALWREGWGSLPVYFAQPNGGFSVTNFGLSDNTINNTPKAQKLLGDFDGDGRTDIFVVSSVGTTIVYYSNGNGTWDPRVLNFPANAQFGASGSAYVVGRFDSNARDDVLVLQRPDKAIVVRSNARGVAGTVTANTVSLAQRPLTDGLSNRIVGDFDGDGQTDIATWRAGTNSTPMFFSNGAGGFVFTDRVHSASENWINDPQARRIVGKFRTGPQQGILIWKPGMTSTPVYFSDSWAWNRVGTFTKSNFATNPIVNDPRHSRIAGDFDGNGLTDIMVVDRLFNSSALRIFFDSGEGHFTDRVMGIRNRDLTGSHPNYAGITASNILVGRFDDGDEDDILMWKSDFGSNPTMFGRDAFNMTATNVTDPYFNLLNSR